MKKLIFALLLIINFYSYGQEVFEYEFDENITLNVLEETEEGDLANGKFIKGTFENETVTCTSSNKAKDRLANIDETDLLKLFQGIKDGILKSTKGLLISEEIVDFQNIKVSKFKFSFIVEGKNKIVESYVFAHKNIIYTIQFMNNEKEFDTLKEFRKSLVNSIKFK